MLPLPPSGNRQSWGDSQAWGPSHGPAGICRAGQWARPEGPPCENPRLLFPLPLPLLRWLCCLGSKKHGQLRAQCPGSPHQKQTSLPLPCLGPHLAPPGPPCPPAIAPLCPEWKGGGIAAGALLSPPPPYITLKVFLSSFVFAPFGGPLLFAF